MPSKTQVKQQRKQAKIDAQTAVSSSPVLTLGIIQTILIVTDTLWVIELLKDQILSGKRVEQEAQDLLCEASTEIRESLAESLLQRCAELKDDPTQARRQAFFFHLAMSLQRQSNSKSPSKALNEMLDERDFGGIVRLAIGQIIDFDEQKQLTHFASNYPDEAEALASALREAADGDEKVGPRKANFLRHLAARIEDKARLTAYRALNGVITEHPEQVQEASDEAEQISDEDMGADELDQFEANESVAEDVDPQALAATIVGERYLTDNMKVSYCELFSARPDLVDSVMEEIQRLTEPELQKANALYRGGEPEDVRRSGIIRKRVHFLRDVLGRLFTSAAGKGSEREGEDAFAGPFPVKESDSQAA